MKLVRSLLLVSSLLYAISAHAGKITVVAAADLKYAMDEIVASFKTGHS